MHSEEEIRQIVAKNLAVFRKKSGLTQSELAEKINYSDKSVSKWERAEGLPDFYVLTQIAAILGITVNDFLAEEGEKVNVQNSIAPLSWRSKVIITALAVGLVWLFATVVYFVLGIVGMESHYLSLVYYCAIPISAIVLTVFTLLWFSKLFSCISVTTLIWSVAFGIYYYIPISGTKYIFEVAAALQVLVILWYVFLKIRSREKKKHLKND